MTTFYIPQLKFFIFSEDPQALERLKKKSGELAAQWNELNHNVEENRKSIEKASIEITENDVRGFDMYQKWQHFFMKCLTTFLTERSLCFISYIIILDRRIYWMITLDLLDL